LECLFTISFKVEVKASKTNNAFDKLFMTIYKKPRRNYEKSENNLIEYKNVQKLREFYMFSTFTANLVITNRL
jgi:ssDNA-specific exonuclease RecJ